MNANPFIQRLRDHAASVGARPRAAALGAEPLAAPDPVPAAAARVQPDQLAFWQSPVARAAINRRITGDPELGPETYFARRHGPSIVAPHALSLRASDAKLEIALVEAGSCERVTGLDEQQGRVDFATGRVPEPLREQVAFQLGTLERFQPPQPLGAVVCRSFLHRRDDLEEVLDRLAATLAPGGLLFVEDFIGPARFQWTDAQMDAINRLLARLPEELLGDLSATDGRRKRSVERPNPADWIASNPNEAVRSDEILPALDMRFERVEVCPYGGAIFHQLFSRIMGNFAGRPELVGLLMEIDALMTDAGALGADYVWGVWRWAGGSSSPV
ncbi:MAG TPA: methyltransferase domain-containing protein [Solirubrobacteraceae bacterium]|jgi:SAM-dependent methyltransferase|nr:methyltransferase domain-containing protein [Solirubrobacteraceae bacterium]